MRMIMVIALIAFFVALPVMAAPEGHGHGGSSHVDKGTHTAAHGDAVSAEAKDAKADGDKVGAALSDVAQDKANG